MLFGKRFYQSFLQEAFDESITIEITTIDTGRISDDVGAFVELAKRRGAEDGVRLRRGVARDDAESN